MRTLRIRFLPWRQCRLLHSSQRLVRIQCGQKDDRGAYPQRPRPYRCFRHRQRGEHTLGRLRWTSRCALQLYLPGSIRLWLRLELQPLRQRFAYCFVSFHHHHRHHHHHHVHLQQQHLFLHPRPRSLLLPP